MYVKTQEAPEKVSNGITAADRGQKEQSKKMGGSTMKGLTEKQKNMIDFIEEFVNANGMAPTIYEIAENFGIKTSTVFAHIRALQKKSILTRSSKARSISLNKLKRKNKFFTFQE